MNGALKKSLPQAVLICVILAAFFSAVFIFNHLDHDHAGADCPVCLHLEKVRNLLRYLSAAGAAFFAVSVVQSFSLCKKSSVYPPVPMVLKVQFNN
jgi:3-deoxy-D-manno-octulosonic acid (KDO) 8-phosphate synthase